MTFTPAAYMKHSLCVRYDIQLAGQWRAVQHLRYDVLPIAPVEELALDQELHPETDQHAGAFGRISKRLVLDSSCTALCVEANRRVTIVRDLLSHSCVTPVTYLCYAIAAGRTATMVCDPTAVYISME